MLQTLRSGERLLWSYLDSKSRQNYGPKHLKNTRNCSGFRVKGSAFRVLGSGFFESKPSSPQLAPTPVNSKPQTLNPEESNLFGLHSDVLPAEVAKCLSRFRV